uniref:Uncharacterized protein n=1 Tax=Rhizophora mucronata TaxID=61149 RepID=A0A2P2ITE6_RHIMU
MILRLETEQYNFGNYDVEFRYCISLREYRMQDYRSQISPPHTFLPQEKKAEP